MKLKPKTYVIGVLVALVLIIILQNTQTVETHVLFFTFALPRALMLFLTALFGVLVGFYLSASRRRKKAAARS